MAESCPTIERWKEHLDGGLAPNVQDELTAHLDQCADCQRTLEHIAAGGDSLLDVARQVGEGTQASQASAQRSWSPTLQQETQAEAAAARDDDLAFLGAATKPGALGRLAHYEALEIIGKGGFGIVLKAFDDKLHRMVAIKVLAPSLAASGTARARFIREARASAPIKNEHVVAIHNVGDEAQPPYLVMELIDGVSLQDKLDRQGPLSLKEILRIGMQMAEGLAAAHKQGLVHRDIKPSNILLENGVERVKITDFGLARAVDDASVTQSGVIAGTPMYMSPEQANGENIDHRSDLFSLGTVLYVMCTGRTPFRATGTMAVLKRVIEDTPRPVREINPEVPEWLEVVIAKLHAKKPDDRFQTAKEVAELLGGKLADVQAGRAFGEPSRVSDRIGAPASMPANRPLTRLGSPKRSALKRAALVIVPLLVLAAVVFRFLPRAADVVQHPPQKAGVLSLRLSDMAMQYRIDGHGANQTGVGVVQLPLEPGEHKIWFALGDRQFETFPFTMTAGKAIELSLEVKGDDGLAVLEGKPLDVTRIGIPTTWVQLFNGKDLAGWRNKPNGKSVWQVIDGVLKGQSNEPVFLWSDREDYGDFHLRVETRVQDSGDGGILFRFAPGKEGYEAEIRPGSEMPTGSLWRYADFAKLAMAAAFPPSYEWFTLEVIARGNRLQVLVNGRVTADVTDTASIKGRLAIQSAGTGGSVEYRKIEIKELPPEEPGWMQLFNGKDLTAWKTHPNQPGDWKVKDGLLVGQGATSHLFSERQDFADFHLRIEAKLNAGGNSGVFFRCPFGVPITSPKGFVPGAFEADFQAANQVVTAGLLSHGGLKSPLALGKVKVDTWFTEEIIAQGDRIILKVNGVTTTDYKDTVRKDLKGPMALQVWGAETVVHFKKIEIKELPPSSVVAPFDAAKAKEHQDAWAKHLGVPVEIENSIGMKLRLIPPGEFKMGTATNDIAKLKKELKQAGEGRDSRAYIDREGLIHPVRLTRPWHMGAHEVTVAQFRQFVEATGYRTEAERDGKGGRVEDPKTGDTPHDPKSSWRKPGSFEAKDDTPVVQVSWNDCREFCRWLSEKEGRIYRLATEAEWEFACRAGSEGPYSFSDAFAIKKHIVFDQKAPEIVASRKANPFGLSDMEGNVSEWCADLFAERYAGVAETDPQGPAEGDWRMYRGGAYDSAAWACRGAVRWADPPSERYANVGFRVVMTGERQAAPPPPAVAPFDSAKAKEHQDAWASYRGWPVEIENSIGMKLRLIPPGEYEMGASDKDADARPEEKPQHRIAIRNPFYIGATEVTRQQYQAVMKQGGKFDPKPILDHPVVAVSWHDATRFCKLLSELAAEKKTGRVYRLPAEVEWEYACRAGTQTPFYFGDIGKIEEHAWFTDNCGGFTNPVAKLKANPWGLYDMLGNVEEWCANTYEGYAAGKIEHDPRKSLPFGTGNNRVARSGSYMTPAKRVTATARTQINPAFATPSLGLRVVMISDPKMKKQPSARAAQLFNIGLAYHNYYDANRKGPATADDLKPFLADDPKAFDALKKGEFVFIYRARLFDLPAGPSGTVLAYEPETPVKGGMVLMADGVAKRVTAAQFKALPLAAVKDKGVWLPLFNGKDLAGWQNPSPRSWTIAEGLRLIRAGVRKKAHIEPTAVGRELIEMPLFLEPEIYVNVPLEATYQAAYRGVPRRWKAVLETSAT